MSVYDIDFRQMTSELLPPNKRNEKLLAFLNVPGDYLQYIHDIVFDLYQNTNTLPTFSGSIAYPKGTRIKGADGAIYELYDTTTLISHGGTYVDPWENPESWVQLVKDWRGTFARSRYNAQALTLEYVLNEYFSLAFRQPDDDTNPTLSDIYVEDNELYNPFFIVADDDEASFVADDELQSTDFIFDDNAAQDVISRTIFVPDSGSSPNPGWWTTFNADGNGESKIRAIADQYILAGCLYDIQTY